MTPCQARLAVSATGSISSVRPPPPSLTNRLTPQQCMRTKILLASVKLVLTLAKLILGPATPPQIRLDSQTSSSFPAQMDRRNTSSTHEMSHGYTQISRRYSNPGPCVFCIRSDTCRFLGITSMVSTKITSSLTFSTRAAARALAQGIQNQMVIASRSAQCVGAGTPVR
jgi:hypothetical protein